MRTIRVTIPDNHKIKAIVPETVIIKGIVVKDIAKKIKVVVL